MSYELCISTALDSHVCFYNAAWGHALCTDGQIADAKSRVSAHTLESSTQLKETLDQSIRGIWHKAAISYSLYLLLFLLATLVLPQKFQFCMRYWV